jgi:hypothetical protein
VGFELFDYVLFIYYFRHVGLRFARVIGYRVAESQAQRLAGPAADPVGYRGLRSSPYFGVL